MKSFSQCALIRTFEGEGHGYWFSIINLTDDTNQTKALKECYKDGDKRKDLITYVKVEDKVCVMNKFKDLKSATYNTVGNDQIILRYADVLLMYAEALNEISYSNSQTSDAMVALNAVHTRAGLSPVQITNWQIRIVSVKPLCWNANRNFLMRDTVGLTLFAWEVPRKL